MSATQALAMHLRRRLLRARSGGPLGEGAPLVRGEGLEFAELRTYAEGDDPRRVDWAATARSGELQTRVMLEESGLCIACAVDLGARMRLGRRRALADAALAYGGLWLDAARDRDRVDAVVGGVPLALGLARGERAAALARRLLAEAAHGAQGAQQALDAATLAYFEARLPRGAALLVVSECYAVEALLDDERWARLARRCFAVARVARDPWGAGLPLRGAVCLRDAGGGAPVTLWVDGRAAQRHAAACAQREQRIVERLASAGWRVRLFDEETSAADLVA